MSERYSKLFALEKNLYTKGSPLLICAGSLLHDSYTKNKLAQIKYKNISDSKIKAVKISITMLDTAGSVIGNTVDYQYLDLNAERDNEFGQKAAVILSSDAVRSFTVNVNEVLFENREKWLWDNNSPWTPLRPFMTLSQAYGDEELAAQYQIRYGSNCIYEPAELEDLWLCTCGAINRSSERNCHSCRRVLSALKEINVNSLRQECSGRLKNESEQQLIDEAESNAKKKKRIKLAAIITPLVFIAVLLAAFVPGAMKRSGAYSDASRLLSAGQYEQAEKAFKALGNYKDSAVQAAKEVPYRKACNIMEMAQKGDENGLKLISVARSSLTDKDNVAVILYSAAAEYFDSLGNYKKSAEYSKQCFAAIEEINNSDIQAEYDAALALLNEKKYLMARDAFLNLGDYKDSQNMSCEAVYQKALSLFNFMEGHNFRKLYAFISTDTETASRAYISQDDALSQGESYIGDLNAAFGRDSVDIDIKEQDEDLVPFQQAVSELFTSLCNYKDSADYIEKIEVLSDYTREFYAFVNAGDLPAALVWLEAYEEEFEGRELWIERLNQYIPFCGTWELNSGDSTLIASSVGQNAVCNSVTGSVVIKDDSIILRLSATDADYIVAELKAEPGSGSFYMNDEHGSTYCAAINVFGRIAYTKYNGSTSPISSCDYSKAQ